MYLNSLTQSVGMLVDPLMVLVVVLGILWGAVAGALPGFNSTIAIGVAIPFTFAMMPTYVVAFLVAINVGVAYGNSIPAILVGLPGTPGAFLTAIDGFALHKKGLSGLALGIQYYAAVFGQFISIFVFLAMVVPLSQLTFVFLSPEMFALYFLGMTAIVSITSDNILKGLAASAFGLLLAMIGRDPTSAVTRFDLLPELRAGLDEVPVIIGLLAVSELFRSMRQSYRWDAVAQTFSSKFPAWSDLFRTTPSVMLGTAIGSVIGAIPGVSGTAAAVISYQQAKLWSKKPEEFGKGSIEGIAANESAQNASQAGEMVPTFGLGIPAGGAMVILLGALLMHGFVPGPLLIKEKPELLYASVVGMLGGTVVLAVIGWPIARVLLKIVTFDRSIVLVGALSLTMIGVYTLNRSIFDVTMVILFGVIGYFMRRYGYSVAAASMALVLGIGLERNLRAGLMLKGGDVWDFVSRPWTALILSVAMALLIYGAYGTFKLARREARLRREAVAGYRARQARKVSAT